MITHTDAMGIANNITCRNITILFICSRSNWYPRCLVQYYYDNCYCYFSTSRIINAQSWDLLTNHLTLWIAFLFPLENQFLKVRRKKKFFIIKAADWHNSQNDWVTSSATITSVTYMLTYNKHRRNSNGYIHTCEIRIIDSSLIKEVYECLLSMIQGATTRAYFVFLCCNKRMKGWC